LSYRRRCYYPCFICRPICCRPIYHCNPYNYCYGYRSFARGVALGLLFGFF